MIRIYHNPRCSKSREGLAILEESGEDFQIIRYLDEVPDASQISDLLKKLEIPARDLIRTQEAVWKKEYAGKSLSEKELIDLMVEHPKLIERPIVVRKDKAVVGRPPEKIHELLAS